VFMEIFLATLIRYEDFFPQLNSSCRVSATDGACRVREEAFPLSGWHASESPRVFDRDPNHPEGESPEPSALSVRRFNVGESRSEPTSGPLPVRTCYVL